LENATQKVSNLGKDIVSLLNETGMIEIACDIAESSLDSELGDGILKDIPIIGTIWKLGGYVLTIRDRLFIKKLGNCISKIKDIPESTRKQFADNLGTESEKIKFGEKLILIIEKQDDFNKASIIGELFRRLIEGDIDHEKFSLLCHSVTACFLGDIDELWIHSANRVTIPHPSSSMITTNLIGVVKDEVLGSALLAAGLVFIQVGMPQKIGAIGSQKEGAIYVLNEQGHLLSKILREYSEQHRKL
jgi:hypothetical protein